MRTKTLIAAAVLAAGLASSQAQNVYSQNVVGYVNVNLAAGYNLIADQLLVNGASPTNNTVQAVFGTSLPSGSTVYAFSGGAFAAPLSYTTKGGWGAGTNAVNPSLVPGAGVFVQVPSAATVTFVGEVPQGVALTTPYAAGFNIVASQVPQAGLLQTDLNYTPNSGDAIYRFTGGAGYQPTVTYTTKGGWNAAQPNIAVAEAFYLQAPVSGNWVRNFSVQ